MNFFSLISKAFQMWWVFLFRQSLPLLFSPPPSSLLSFASCWRQFIESIHKSTWGIFFLFSSCLNFDLPNEKKKLISILSQEQRREAKKCENDRHEWQVSGLSASINVPSDDTWRERKPFDASRRWWQFNAPKSAADDDGQWKWCNRWRWHWPGCDSQSIWWDLIFLENLNFMLWEIYIEMNFCGLNKF